MNSFIALLRGINVGGHKKILMADLRVLFEKLGFENVRTFIQSGNVIFLTNENNPRNLEKIIKDEITRVYGFEVTLLVKTPSEIQVIFNNCPFSEEKKINSYFILLNSFPKKELIELTNQISYPDEEFYLTNSCVYFYCSKGYGKSKCGNNFFEKNLKVSATARNYKTLLKLIELSN